MIRTSFAMLHGRKTRSTARARIAAMPRGWILICLCVHSSALPAADWSLSGIVGSGNHVNIAGVEAQVPSGFRGALTEEWSWSVRWGADVACWWARNYRNSDNSLWEVGMTPIVELRRALASGASYFFEGGIGVHLLSHTRIDERELSTAFQFGELVGTGVTFGDHGQYRFGMRLQHISNGRIKEPNCGVTFGELRISYRWD